MPQFKNTYVTAPEKIFLDVLRNQIYGKSRSTARRKFEVMSVTSPNYFCEDHFYLPNNMENYMQYHIMGFVNKIMLKPGTLSSEFHCQPDRRRRLPSSNTSSPAAIKRQKLALIQEALEESNLESNIEKETTTVIGLETAVETVQQPTRPDKGVQVLVKSKYFRSKFTQTDIKSHDIATSPSKTWAKTIATSPFKVEDSVKLERPCVPNVKITLIDRSDSDVSQYTPSTSSFEPASPSMTSLQKFK